MELLRLGGEVVDEGLAVSLEAEFGQFAEVAKADIAPYVTRRWDVLCLAFCRPILSREMYRRIALEVEARELGRQRSIRGLDRYRTRAFEGTMTVRRISILYFIDLTASETIGATDDIGCIDICSLEVCWDRGEDVGSKVVGQQCRSIVPRELAWKQIEAVSRVRFELIEGKANSFVGVEINCLDRSSLQVLYRRSSFGLLAYEVGELTEVSSLDLQHRLLCGEIHRLGIACDESREGLFLSFVCPCCCILLRVLRAYDVRGDFLQMLCEAELREVLGQKAFIRSNELYLSGAARGLFHFGLPRQGVKRLVSELGEVSASRIAYVVSEDGINERDLRTLVDNAWREVLPEVILDLQPRDASRSGCEGERSGVTIGLCSRDEDGVVQELDVREPLIGELECVGSSELC